MVKDSGEVRVDIPLLNVGFLAVKDFAKAGAAVIPPGIVEYSHRRICCGRNPGYAVGRSQVEGTPLNQDCYGIQRFIRAGNRARNRRVVRFAEDDCRDADLLRKLCQVRIGPMPPLTVAARCADETAACETVFAEKGLGLRDGGRRRLEAWPVCRNLDAALFRHEIDGVDSGMLPLLLIRVRSGEKDVRKILSVNPVPGYCPAGLRLIDAPGLARASERGVSGRRQPGDLAEFLAQCLDDRKCGHDMVQVSEQNE